MDPRLQLIPKLVAMVLELLALVGLIKDQTAETSKEHEPYRTEALVRTIDLNVTSPTFGLVQAAEQRDDILTQIQAVRQDTTEPHLPTIEDVLEAVAGIQVSLPETPPPGYGGGDPEADIWHRLIYIETFSDGVQPYYFQDQQNSLGTYMNIDTLYNGVTWRQNADFVIYALSPWGMGDALTTADSLIFHAAPEVDWSQWNGTDSLVTFLNSIDAYPHWGYGSGNWPGITYACRPWVETGGSAFSMRCVWRDSDLPYISGRHAANMKRLANRSLPVWPGPDGIVWGTAVELGHGFASLESCDGVVVTIEETPSRIGSYDFNGTPSHVHIGSIAFTADFGIIETSQPFSFPQHLVMPKQIAAPTGFIGRAAPGVVGSVNPFTIQIT